MDILVGGMEPFFFRNIIFCSHYVLISYYKVGWINMNPSLTGQEMVAIVLAPSKLQVQINIINKIIQQQVIICRAYPIHHDHMWH
jgi:hypothetical protein